MASSSGPGPERIRLINKITDALNTVEAAMIERFRICYACLWLADMEKLQALVDCALPDNGQHDPMMIYNMFFRVESRDRIGQNCEPSLSLHHYVRLTVCSVQGNKRINMRDLLTHAKGLEFSLHRMQ